MHPIFSILWRTYTARNRLLSGMAINRINKFDSSVIPAMKEITETSGLRDFRISYQAFDILKALEQYAPRSIVELGSGRSTVLFSTWANVNNANFVSFEQDPHWADFVNAACPSKPVTLTELVTSDSGARYSADIPKGADFISMDGPAAHSPTTPGPFGKAIYSDVPDFLKAGNRPRIIMCEGRLDTVYAIQNSAADYSFVKGFDWCFHSGDAIGCIPMRRHSMFIRI